MKNRMLKICILPMILLVVVMIVVLVIPTQLSFPLTNEKIADGFRNDMSYDIKLLSGGFDLRNITAVNIHNRNGVITNDKDYYQDLNNQYDYYGNYVSDGVSVNEGTLVMDRSIYNDQSFHRTEDSQCKTVKEDVDEVAVSYDAAYMKNKSQYGLNYDDEPFLTTDMKFVTQPGYQFYKSTTTCEYMDGEDTAYFLKSESDDDLDHNESVQKYKNDFYFMPKTRPYMQGVNKLYKIKIVKNKTNSVLEYKGKTEVLAELPQGYEYDVMLILKNRIHVFAHNEKTSFIFQYDMDGKLLRKTDLENIFQFYSYMDMKINDQYILWSDEHKIYVYDSDKNTLIQQINQKRKDAYIEDMIYKNQRIYVLYNESNSKEKIKKGEVLGYQNTVRYHIAVIEKDKTVYEADHVITDIMLKTYTLQSGGAEFVRDAS